MEVRVGFYGAGGVAHYHMSHLIGIRDVAIVAVYDPVKERRCLVEKEFGARPYHSLEDMLGKADLDALYVCVPPYLHGNVEREAAGKGIHLFVEKPVDLDLARAKETARIIRDAGVISMVGYNWRYMDIVDKCCQLIDKRTVGMVLGYWMGGLPGVAWWQSRSTSGGQMVEQASHVFDLARYLVADVETVYSAAALRLLRHMENVKVDDVATTTLRFRNGALGSISCTCALSPGYTVGMHLILLDMILEISLQVPGGLDYQHAIPRLNVIKPGEQRTIESQINSYRRENELFIEAVKTKNSSSIRTPYSDAVKTLAVTLAAQKAADTQSVQKV